MFDFFFHVPGILPCANDLLSNNVIEYCNWSQHSGGEMSSGPVALFGSVFVNIYIPCVGVLFRLWRAFLHLNLQLYSVGWDSIIFFCLEC